MGQRGEPTKEVLALVDEVCRELESVANPKYVWREYDITVADGTVQIGGVVIESKRLSAHLAGCHRCAVLAATLGIGADSLISRSFALGAARGAAAQAAGAAMIEEVCDRACRELAAASSFNTKPRFSPGYGDFALSYQRMMLALSDAERRIGITLAESSMMIPTKSVTALVGLTKEQACAHKGCAQCDKKDCEFRNEI